MCSAVGRGHLGEEIEASRALQQQQTGKFVTKEKIRME